MRAKQLSYLDNKADPPLKWAGGKSWLVPRLRELWQGHEKRRLVVPFCGGLGDVLGLWPHRALMNDVNPHLVNFYRWWAAGQVSVNGPVNFTHEESIYYQNRDRFNELTFAKAEDSLEAATLFYYLNRTGFNGLCRFNRLGGFNAPYGRREKKGAKPLPPLDYGYWLNGYKLPTGWSFTCGDFTQMQVLRYSTPLAPADLIYADPPYDGTFVGYSKGGFSWVNQIALVDWLSLLQGPIIASNAATPRIIKLYKAHGFHVELVDGPRSIACNGDRAKVKEMLATKNVKGKPCKAKF